MGALQMLEDTLESDGHVWEVRAGDGLRYGLYVEFGTAITPAQPYIFPAINHAIRMAPALWEEAEGLPGGTIDNFVKRLAEVIYERARQRVPVDTGALRDSLTIQRIE